MIFATLLLLQISLPPPDSIIQRLSFNPSEELNIPKDSVDLQSLDHAGCRKIETRYPVGIQRGFQKFFGVTIERTVKTQECFVLETNLKEMLVIVTYYDEDLGLKFPIAFVKALKDSSTGHYIELWGKADSGFIETGIPTRKWLTLFPDEKSVRNQLIELLLPGFKKAGKTKK